MTSFRLRPLLLLALAGVLTLPAPLGAQASPSDAQAVPGDQQDAEQGETPQVVPPDELERLKQRLENLTPLEFDRERVAFYSQVVAREPRTFAEYARGDDLLHAPTPRGNPMTHQEFLNMVTPRELYSSGGITATELLQFALTNYVGRKLLEMGLEEIRNAQDEQEMQAIRDRIQRELATLKAAEDN